MENVWENVKSELKAPRKGRKGAKNANSSKLYILKLSLLPCVPCETPLAIHASVYFSYTHT
jgi:hypothetical protein